jgi:hypothetical protein
MPMETKEAAMNARTVHDFIRTLCSDLDAGRAPRAFVKTVAPAIAGLAQALSIGCGGAQDDTALVVTPVPSGRYVEVCNDGADNDLDGLIDCADGDCAGLAICPVVVAAYAAPPVPAGEICGDGADNDGDGLVDCADSDCAAACNPVVLYGVPIAPPPREVCNDGLDNDRDGRTDCADSDCGRMNYCAPQVALYSVPIAPPVGPENCFDGIDNDRDGAVDFADSDCGPVPEYAAVFAEDCDDGVDNDRDGLTDCSDGDCRGAAHCTMAPAYGVPFPRENCGDGVDNDGDGRVDGADPDCRPVMRYMAPLPR